MLKIEDCTTAKDAWTKLQEYTPKGSGILNSTFRKFETLSVATRNHDAQAYINKFQSILRKFGNLSKRLVLDKNYKIYRFHSGLLPTYSSYVETYNQNHDAFGD